MRRHSARAPQGRPRFRLAGAFLTLLVGVALVLGRPQSAAAQQKESTLIVPVARIDQARAHTEVSFVSASAIDLPGGVAGEEPWTAVLRWGRILARPSRPLFLRGSFEYAAEAVPVTLLRQNSRAVYGSGLTPLLLQYNFDSGKSVVPYVQTGVGILFTSQEFPAGTSRVNFTPQGGVGFYWRRWTHRALVFGVRFQHISNAGMVHPNPGYNALQIQTGFAWFR